MVAVEIRISDVDAAASSAPRERRKPAGYWLRRDFAENHYATFRQVYPDIRAVNVKDPRGLLPPAYDSRPLLERMQTGSSLSEPRIFLGL